MGHRLLFCFVLFLFYFLQYLVRTSLPVAYDVWHENVFGAHQIL